jgi:hypothetical protein
MGLDAQQATGCERITVLADRGYFNRDQVLACEDTGVLPSIPKTLTSQQCQARALHTAGLPLRRRKGPLYLSSWSAPEQSGRPFGSPRRHGSIPSPDSLFYLPPQDPLHTRKA